MSPFRLLVLLVLLYILFKLLFGRSSRLKKKADSTLPPRQDVLVEDPVCHTYVPKNQAVAWQRDDQTYYFCSTKCRDHFQLEKGDKR